MDAKAALKATGLLAVLCTTGLAFADPPRLDQWQVENLPRPEAVETAILPTTIDPLLSDKAATPPATTRSAQLASTARPVQLIEGDKQETVVYRNALQQQSPYQAGVARFIAGYNRKLSPAEANAMAQAIMHYSNQYGVDFRLLTGLIAVESSFKRDAVSSSGAIGLGQLKPDTAKWLGVSDPYNPVDNIAGTARFLSWLLRKYNGSMDHALAAYFQGPGYLDRNGITPVCLPYLQKINKALSGLM